MPVNYYFDRVAPEIEAAVRHAIDRLEALGARLVEVEIPMTRYIQATQWGLMVPEATAYHERTLRAVPDLYGADVRVLLEAGELMTAGDYLRAQRARTLMRRAWLDMLDGADGVDVIAAPTVPLTAAKAGQTTVTWGDGTVESVSDAYVRLSAPANVTGVPSLTVPVGRDPHGMPIGMQLMGKPFGEAVLLRAGHAYERTGTASGLHRPPGGSRPRGAAPPLGYRALRTLRTSSLPTPSLPTPSLTAASVIPGSTTAIQPGRSGNRPGGRSGQGVNGPAGRPPVLHVPPVPPVLPVPSVPSGRGDAARDDGFPAVVNGGTSCPHRAPSGGSAPVRTYRTT